MFYRVWEQPAARGPQFVILTIPTFSEFQVERCGLMKYVVLGAQKELLGGNIQTHAKPVASLSETVLQCARILYFVCFSKTHKCQEMSVGHII